jgi:AcrR family transcriptional regulator
MEVLNKKKTFRQQEIVDCVRNIITSKGIKSLTIRAIADELGVTDGALYRHFKSKNEIIALLIDDIEESLLAAIQGAAEKSNTPWDKLKNIFVSHLSYSEQRKGISFIVINETLSIKDRSLQKKMFAVIHKYLKTIKAILADGARKGVIRKDVNLTLASVTFLGMVQSLVTFWALSGYRYSLRKERLDDMLNVYKRGICFK